MPASDLERASRYDQLQGDRFAALNFDSRNIVPLGYAVFAVVLGTITGLLVRRTVPAMALTLAIFAAIQILTATAIRAHLMPPVTTTVVFDAEAMKNTDGLMVSETDGWVEDYIIPGTWSLTSEGQLFNPDGTPFTIKEAKLCMSADRQAARACQFKQNLRFSHEYQPADRYWPFQWIELSAFIVLTMLLTGFGFWRIRSRPS